MPLAIATEAATGGRRSSPASMRIAANQALDRLRSDDLVGVGMEADSVRAKLHPGGVVTYQIDRNINYTNVCTEYC
jgi:cyclic dehypoxanthinyl futalosine synthase